MADRERRIQEIAYLLWEGEGRPDGQAERFWHMAEAAYVVEAALGDGKKSETDATGAVTALADAAVIEDDLAAGREGPAEVPAPGKRAAKSKTAAAGEGKSEPKATKTVKAKSDEPSVPKVSPPKAATPQSAPAAKPKGRK